MSYVEDKITVCNKLNHVKYNYNKYNMKTFTIASFPFEKWTPTCLQRIYISNENYYRKISNCSHGYYKKGTFFNLVQKCIDLHVFGTIWKVFKRPIYGPLNYLSYEQSCGIFNSLSTLEKLQFAATIRSSATIRHFTVLQEIYS